MVFVLAQQMLAKVPHATLHKQENAGAHNTINRAIGISRSEYIAVLNSERYLRAFTKLERCGPSCKTVRRRVDRGQTGHHGRATARAAECGRRDRLAGPRREFSRTQGCTHRVAQRELRCDHVEHGVFRALWDAAGGFQPLRYCHDLDFLMFACAQSSVFLDREHERIVYRVHENNTIKEDLSKVRVETRCGDCTGVIRFGSATVLGWAGRTGSGCIPDFLAGQAVD